MIKEMGKKRETNIFMAAATWLGYSSFQRIDVKSVVSIQGFMFTKVKEGGYGERITVSKGSLDI